MLTETALIALLTDRGLTLIHPEHGALAGRFDAPANARPTRTRHVVGTPALIVHWGGNSYSWIDTAEGHRRDFFWPDDLEHAFPVAGGRLIALQGHTGAGLLDPDDGSLVAFAADRAATGFLRLTTNATTPAEVRLVAASPSAPMLLLARPDLGHHELWDTERGVLLRRFAPDAPGEAWSLSDRFLVRRAPARGMEFWPLANLSTPAILDLPFDTAQLLGDGSRALVGQWGAQFMISVDDAGRATADALHRQVGALAAAEVGELVWVLDTAGNVTAVDADGTRQLSSPIPGWRDAAPDGGACGPERRRGRLDRLGDYLRVSRCGAVLADVAVPSGDVLPFAQRAIREEATPPTVLYTNAQTLLLSDRDGSAERTLAHEQPVRLVNRNAAGQLVTEDAERVAHVWRTHPEDTTTYQLFGDAARLAGTTDADALGLFLDRRLQVISASRGEPLADWTFDAPVSAASIDRGGLTAVVGLEDGSVLEVDASGTRVLFRHDSVVRFVTRAHGRVMSGSADGVAAVIDRASGTVENTLHHWGGVDHGVALGPEGSVVTATVDGFVQFHDLAHREQLVYASLARRIRALGGDGASAIVVADAPAGEDVSLIDPVSLTRLGALPTALRGVNAGIVSLDRSRALLARGSEVWIHDLLAGESLGRADRSPPGGLPTPPLISAAVSPDAATFAYAQEDGAVHAWNEDGWHELVPSPRPTKDAPAPRLSPQLLAFTRDGRHLVGRSDAGTHVWQVDGLERVEVPVEAPPASRLQALRTERRIATEVLRIEPDGSIRVVHRFAQRLDAPHLGVDGSRLFYRREDGSIEMFDLNRSEVAMTISIGGTTDEIVLTGDGRTLALSDAAGGLRAVPIHGADLVAHAERLQTGAF